MWSSCTVSCGGVRILMPLIYLCKLSYCRVQKQDQEFVDQPKMEVKTAPTKRKKKEGPISFSIIKFDFYYRCLIFHCRIILSNFGLHHEGL